MISQTKQPVYSDLKPLRFVNKKKAIQAAKFAVEYSKEYDPTGRGTTFVVCRLVNTTGRVVAYEVMCFNRWLEECRVFEMPRNVEFTARR